jgi:hypothetical protein
MMDIDIKKLKYNRLSPVERYMVDVFNNIETYVSLLNNDIFYKYENDIIFSYINENKIFIIKDSMIYDILPINLVYMSMLI